uniref:Fus6 n=1 Tax=Arundo donax TaxID=35708 RepID=A0A0A9E6X1_ARUDO
MILVISSMLTANFQMPSKATSGRGTIVPLQSI